MAYTPVPQAATSGGSGASIGSPITGTGGNNRVLGIDGSGNLKDFADLTFNETTNDLAVVDSESGGTVGATIENTSNTASSAAELRVKVAGGTAANPRVALEIAGSKTWVVAADNATSDNFAVMDGSTTRLSINASGQLGVNVTSATHDLWVEPATAGAVVRATVNCTGTTNHANVIATNSTSCSGVIRVYGATTPLTTAGVNRTSLVTFTAQAGAGAPGAVMYGAEANCTVYFISNTTVRASIDGAGNFAVGTAALATTATDGFLYVPTCAGTPTGVPTTKTGLAPIVIDSTNHKFYFYDGAWRDAGP